MSTENRPAGTVIIVDDDDGVRQALALLMETSGHAACQHESGEALLAAAPPDGPACLLLDLRMPGMDGLEVQRRLQADGWDVPVIFLTGHGDVPEAVDALKHGALDFFQKSGFDRRALLKGVRHALEVHSELLKRKAADERIERCIGSLTPREREVACLAAGGKANKLIAMELGISERTVEIHRGRAMKKLRLRTAPELIRLARHLQAD